MDPRTTLNEATSNGRSAIDKAETEAQKSKIKSEAEKVESTARTEAVNVSDALQQMKEAAASVFQALSSLGLASTDLAKNKVDEGRDSVRQFETTAEEYLRERPLAAVGIAFVAGWAVSKLLQGNRRH